MGGSVVGAPTVVDNSNLGRVDAPTERRAPLTDPRPLPRVESRPADNFERGTTKTPRGTTPAPVPSTGPRAVSPDESRRYLDEIRKGHYDPDRWRTAHPVTEGLRSGAITQEQLDGAIREGEGALARHFLGEIGRGRDLDARSQRFVDQGLERGDITREQLNRATEDGESFRTLESLRRGNGRIEGGAGPADHPAIRRGIERGLFSSADVDAANRAGEQRKREALY